MRNLKKFLALVLVMMMAFSLLVTVNAATTQADYEAAYETLENYGIFKGVTGNAPSLNTNFTRAQMAAVAYRVATGDINDEQIGLYAAYAAEQFTDVNEGDWYAGYIGFCANRGIVVGLGDGRFGPSSYVTGMQASAMLLRLLGYGRNGEFEGTGWDKNVAAKAAQVNITKGLTDGDLISYASRGMAAYLTLNGATIPDMVTYYYGDYYSPNGYPLISAVDSNKTKDYDVWGAPCTSYTTTVTFNWIQGGVVKVIPHDNPDEALLETWEPVTQASVYAAAGLVTGGDTLDVYTNGADNVASGVTISNSDVTNLLGGQGRWTRVYDDRIVYVDTFLSVMDSVTNEVKVNGITAIAPQYTTTSYYNNFDPPTTKPYPDAGYIGTVTKTNAVAGFAEDTVLSSYAVTTKTDGTAFSADSQIKSLVEPGKVKTTQITVLAIVKNADGTEITGVVGTNGNTYLYNCTYTYNGGSAGNGATIDRLTDTDINSTVTLYLDEHNNILGVEPAATSTSRGVGVVVGWDAKRAKAGQYYGVITVLTKDNTTVDVNFIDVDASGITGISNGGAANQQPYGTEDDAAKDAELLMGQLVSWAYDTASATAGTPYPGYSLVTAANNGTPVDVTGNKIEAGDAGALKNNASATALLNDDTVFFVANYQMQNSKGGYVFTNYSIVTGFQKIQDLGLSNGSTVVSNPNSEADAGKLQVEYLDYGTADEWADYVLVINAVNKSTNEVVPTDTYAFLADPYAFVKVYDNYYQYNAILNGVANQPFKVQYNATGNVTQTGLYTYSEYTNDGWARVDLSTNTIAGGGYYYEAGVMYDDNSNPASSTFYYTVAEGAAIYFVNPSTGSSTKVDISLDLVQMAYPTNTIWYQTNQYGYINLIYVEVGDSGVSAGTGYTPLTSVTLDNETDYATTAPVVGSYLKDYKFKVSATNPTTGTFDGTVTVTHTWLKLNGFGQYVPYTAEAFEPGIYRLQLTLSLKNSGSQKYSIGSGTTVTYGGSVFALTNAKGATVISDIIDLTT